MTVLVPDDLIARQQALDVTQSCLVQAPAGSGKTELLTQRILALLAVVEREPEEILAMTFTRKAASEMKARVMSALRQAQFPEPSDEPEKSRWRLARMALNRDAKMGWRLLETPHRLRIMTIDGLCHAIVQQSPMMAKLAAVGAITEAPEEAYRAAVARLLDDADPDMPWQSALQRVLQHLDYDATQLEQLLLHVLNERDPWIRKILPNYSDAESLKNYLTRILSEMQKISLNTLLEAWNSHSECWQDLYPILLTILPHATHDYCPALLKALEESNFENYSIETWCVLGEFLTTKSDEIKKDWKSKDGVLSSSEKGIGKEEKNRRQELKKSCKEVCEKLRMHTVLVSAWKTLRHIPRTHSDILQIHILQDILLLAHYLVALLQQIFAERGEVDFTEISLGAVRAMSELDHNSKSEYFEISEVLQTLDYQLRHILIDEFQDTSVTQFELLEGLISNWQTDDGRTLFLVGDPMQSIYRFRQADVGLFYQAREFGVKHIHLLDLRLTTNFRSDTKLVEWFNDQFSNIFPCVKEASSGAVNYESATAIKRTIDENIENVVCVAEYVTVEEEMQAIINKIITIKEKEPTASIAVLVRKRKRLDGFLQCLKIHNIPVVGVETQLLSRRSDLMDLLALTQILFHPADHLAWLTVLRAPWCGCILKDLQIIRDLKIGLCDWMHASPSYISENLVKLKENISQDGWQRLIIFHDILNVQLELVHRYSPRRVVESTWLQLSGPATLIDTGISDIERFWRLVESSTIGNMLDMDRLQRSMVRLYASTRLGNQATPIEVMTIHKSKGLEFDYVFVPFLEEPDRPQDTKLLAWAEISLASGPALLIAPTSERGGEKNALNTYIRQLEKERFKYEAQRLFYVACTRTVCQLWLSASCAKTISSSSFLSLAKTILTPHPYVEHIAVVESLSQKSNDFENDEEEDNDIDESAVLQITALKRLHAHSIHSLVEFSLHEKNKLMDDVLILEDKNKDLQKNAVLIAEYRQALKALGCRRQEQIQRYVGVLLHRYLEWYQYLSQQEKIVSFNESWDWLNNKLIRDRFLSESEIEAYAPQFRQAIRNIIGDSILQKALQHMSSKTEWSLSSLHNKSIRHHQLDLSFVDEQGTCWIIDYKSHRPNESSTLSGYQQQLMDYARLLISQKYSCIRLGLFFLIENDWLHWSNWTENPSNNAKK